MKRIISIMLAASMVFSIVGCNKTNEGTSDSSKTTKATTTTNSTDDKEESNELKPLEISIGHWEAGTLTKGGKDDAILQLLQDKFNVKFKGKSVSWSDYKEKYKLWAASDELPDIFATNEVTTQTYDTWVKQGIIRSLPTDMSAYPKINSLFDLVDVKPLEQDGQFYFIPRRTYTESEMWVMDKNLIIRKDWLQKLGIDMPQSYEELETALKQIVKSDLDGNGVDDTIGVTHKAIWAMGPFFMDVSPALIAKSWVEEDGQWIPPYMSDDVLPGIQRLRNLYQDGLLDRDFAIMKTNDGIEKFCQGNSAVLATQAVTSHLSNIKKSWDKYQQDLAFEDAVAILPLWANEEGVKYAYNSPIYWSETYINANVDDEKMERILMMYEYLLSDEFKEYKSYGFEGVDYKKEGDKYVSLLDGQQLGDKYTSLKTLAPLVAWGQEADLEKSQVSYEKYGEAVTNLSVDFYENAKKDMTPYPVNFDIRLMTTPAKSKIASIKFWNDVTKVIISDKNVEEEWAKVLEGYKAQGVEQAIKEVNERVNK